MAIWMGSKLNQNDTGTYGPRIAELRYGGNWSTNQIRDYSGFFQNASTGTKYDQIHNFASTAYLDENGTLNSTYGTYNGASLPVQVRRDYVMVPNEPFLVVRYTLSNSSAAPVTWNLLDQVHLNNTSPSTAVTATYDATRRAFFGDMTASGQYAIALGALQSPTSYQAGNDADCTAADATASGWCQFDAGGTLSDNGALSTPDVDLGFQNAVTLAAGASQTLYYYLGLGSNLVSAQAAVDTARAHSGDYWFTTTAADYATWLNSGRTVSTADSGVNTAYLRNLVVIKNAQNPTNGLFPAATNPGSYGYKAWVRDSSFDAMALDAAGHYAEAELYWNWMASNQLANGTWHTTYDEWSGAYVSFVEPEYDSLGEFLVGVYKHYAATESGSFLNGIWSKIEAAADSVQTSIGSNGFGAADASIWEESVQYNVFTQALDVAGLRAAALLAGAHASASDADAWNGAASTILSAVQRSYSWNPAGMFDDTTGYFDRGVTTSGAVNTLIDASSLALVVFGGIDASSGRAASMVKAIETGLTHGGVALARYTGDTYYYSSPYDPAGDESGTAEPVWPNVTMFDAIYKVFTGQSDDAMARLQWYASRSGVGYMPPGEAVSWSTGQPIVSTMSEPLTASSFLMAALTYSGSYDPRVTASNSNMGTYSTMSVTTNPAGDWLQWQQIPYATFPANNTGSGSSMTDVRRVYVANDANNIYLRVDNASGSLSNFNTAPRFALLVYSQDFNHSGTLQARSTGEYGATLDHPMNYLAARWSDSSNFSTFNAGNTGWNFNTNLSSVAPQWDPSTGRIETAIPISSLASGGGAAVGAYAYMDIELAYQNPTTGAWSDDDIGGVHYRLTGPGTAWLYGSVEGNYITAATTDAARYAPGQPVTVTGTVLNPETASLSSAVLRLHYTHLGTSVGSDQYASVNLTAGQAADFAVSWTPPSADYQGYLITTTLTNSAGVVLGTAQSAVDVSSDWSRFPRYGFVTDFGDDYDQNLIAQRLNLYHIDGVQFYDWEYKHHEPLAGSVSSPASTWVNIDNDNVYAHSVTALINAVHGHAGAAMNYNLIYGAWAGYGSDGSGVDYHQGLWWNNNCTNQGNFSLPSSFAAPNIYFFNPGDPGWQAYLFGRESDAFSVYHFDGWQMDQLGTLVGNTVYTCGGSLVDPPTTFSGFITAAKAALNKSIVFNAPGQYSQQNVAANPNLSFLYTECWPSNGQVTLGDLRTVVTQNSTWSGGTKNTVIAAYPDQDYSDNFSDSAPGFLNTAGVLYQDAAIFAAGGSHIELGDVDHMLDQPNYLNKNLLMPASLQQGMVNDYNFLTAYENLLRDGLTDSSNQIALPGGPATSTTGAAGTVWAYARSKAGTDVLNFINLLNLSTTDWMDTNANQPIPTVQQNVTTKYYYGSGTPTSVQLASPDLNGGAAQSLAFTTGSDSGGSYLQFTLPSLDYWDMVWITK